MKKIYTVRTSHAGAGSNTTFRSWSAAARFAKYLLDSGERGTISVSVEVSQ